MATMVDSGANHNIININTLKQIHKDNLTLTPTNIIFKVGDTHEVPVLGKFKLTFRIQNQTFIEPFFVMQKTNFSILLGNSFLHKYKCNIDYDTNTLTAKQNNTTLTRTHIFPKDSPHKQPTFPLTNIEETLIKKDGITSIETQLSNKHYKTLPDQQFAIITKEINLLHSHQCVVSEGFHFLPSTDNGRIIVHLLNTSGRDIHLPPHTIISQFRPCQVDELTDGGYAMEIDTKDLHNTTPPHETPSQEHILHNMQTTTLAEETNIHKQLLQATNTPIPNTRGFKNIQSIFDTPDFTTEELQNKFSQPGIKDILSSLEESLIHIPGGLTPDRSLALKQFIAKHQSCWSIDENPRHVKNYNVTIPHNNRPTVDKLRPYTAEEVKHWTEHVQKLTKDGTVEESSSPWRSASFLVKKPNGGYRFVTDYRRANLAVPKQHWPLVRIESALSALGSANVVSSFDACAAYHQIPLSDLSSKEWTSFAGPTCQLQYTCLPQGYKNSVSEYSRFTSYVLGNLMWASALTYLDDFLIWSPSFEQHLIDLDAVFCRVEHFGIQFSAKKSLFCRRELPYLGHIIEPGKGIKPNPKKVQAIKDLKDPTTKKQLLTFLQSISFYRRMIPCFNRLAEPLRQKLNTKKWSKMTDTENESYQTLKESLIKAPILAIPDLSPDSNPFYILTDASKEGLGAILMQTGKDNKLHPISYVSRMTDEKEKLRYSTYQLEMSAIVWALSVFKPYLRHKNVPFTLRTDCQSLCWLLKTDHDTTVKKWILQLTEFDFQIEYIKGKDNPADLLSRSPLPVPQGYFQEQPMEPLYSEDHDNLMTWIIQILNKRAEDKKQHRHTLSTNNTNTNTITTENTQHNTQNTQELIDTLRTQTEAILTDYKHKTAHTHYNIEINNILQVMKSKKPLRQSRRQRNLPPDTPPTLPIPKQQRPPNKTNTTHNPIIIADTQDT